MKMRVVLPLILALIAGLGCLVVLRQVLDESGNVRQAEPVRSRAVLVAAVDLEDAQQIGEGMLEVKSIPEPMIPEDHFVESTKLIGRVLRSHVPAGYPITESCLHPEGFTSGFESRIPSGYRAYTIKVDEWSSVSGFVVPGSRVDVVAEVRDDVTRRMRSKTVLQNVEVAAVGSATSREDLTGEKGDSRAPKADRRAVTLFLTPREVEIMHESRTGRLNLALRSTADDSTYDSEPEVELSAPTPPPPVPLTQTVVEAKSQPAQAAPKPPERISTWQINGNNIEQVFYVKLGGIWHRETPSRNYSRQLRESVDTTPMPVLKTRKLPGDTRAVEEDDGAVDQDEKDPEAKGDEE